jgi:hypothetical protein
MGWMLKAGLLLVALFAAAVGAWIITIPILGLLFLPSLFQGKRGRSGESTMPSSRSPALWLNAVGVALVLLGSVAYFSGGTFSPIVLFAAGAAVLFRRRLSIRVAARSSPIEGSILLRSTLNPFRWSAVAEAKVSTRDIEGALSGISERLLFVSSPAPRIFMVFSTNSFGRVGAEEKLTKRMKSAVRALVPLGVYLLPLHSAEAVAVTTLKSARIKPPTEDQHRFISASDYGTAAVEGQHGFVQSFELYTRADETPMSLSVISGMGERTQGLLTVREFLQEALKKTGAPHPDSYTAFLSSMAATEGEILGQRVTQSEAGQGQVLLVASLGTPQVELTRAQLQAVVRVYG